MTFASTTSAASCNPNFQGHTQAIYALQSATGSVNKWTPVPEANMGAHIVLRTLDVNPTMPEHQFLVQFTGHPDDTYIFRLHAQTYRNIALTAGANGDLTMGLLDHSNITPSQKFTIKCETCPYTDASGATEAKQCTIQNPASGLCILGSNPGETLSLGSCSAAGIYQFQVAQEAQVPSRCLDD
ncbi:hypothetical protein C0995_002828 [Termitomyces sp. Mi166|nr:hypothetical protein C0995_002828 [Termitomyces sp. Mi166\